MEEDDDDDELLIKYVLKTISIILCQYNLSIKLSYNNLENFYALFLYLEKSFNFFKFNSIIKIISLRHFPNPRCL